MPPFYPDRPDNNAGHPPLGSPSNTPSSSGLYIPGQLLLSTPVIGDGIFSKSTILLTEHDESGASGIILNHPLSKKVGELLDDPKFAPLHDIDLHLGGPVARAQLTFTALTWDHENDLLRTFSRISSSDAIERLDDPHTRVGAYVGYTGWAAQQLENELYRQSWLTLPPSSQLITSTHLPSLWKDTLTNAGPHYQLIAQSPSDLTLN